MGRDDLIRYVEEQLNTKPDFPEFRAGDTITVHYKIKEGNKERIQQFQEMCIRDRENSIPANKRSERILFILKKF